MVESQANEVASAVIKIGIRRSEEPRLAKSIPWYDQAIKKPYISIRLFMHGYIQTHW